MISFSCSRCGKAFSLKPEFAGRNTTCSQCKEPLVVPAPEAKIAPLALPKIAFSCTNCGMKFNVPLEFAGRSTKCPTCKEPLHVPTPNETMAYVPAAGQINGAPSSLARAGVEGGVTLGNQNDDTSRLTPLADLLDGRSTPGERYVIEKELARGGMGAVMCAVDCDIRREVAVKYLLDQSSSVNKLRFVEEAQITGQLEHPNIVPIHELGVDAEKRIFFSMKMVKGRSLQEILKAFRNEPKAADKEFSQGRLLNIFVNVCNALDYAHSRGVVHRDLKPANIMVGDFGEVYLMDWGLAKVLKRSSTGTSMTVPVLAVPVAVAAPSGPFDFTPAPPLALAVPVPAAEAALSTSGHVVTSREGDADLTQAGVVMGTPVYMPPEQAAGRVHDIDERSDIYSMGAILYELLTLQPPIDRAGGLKEIVARVNKGRIDPPEKKAPERARAGKIPSGLAAIAMKALAMRKSDRYQTIVALRQDIERFMEGRSVTAKPDTIREMAVKLLKRNKGVSIATAAATVILLIVAIWSFVSILIANRRTQDAYNAYVTEQKEKQAQAKRSVPSLVRATRMLIAEKQFDEALNQINTAVSFDESEPEARLLRAQLLLHQYEFDAARKDLEACLKQKPGNDEAMRLLEITRDARADKLATLLPLAKALVDQKLNPLAEPVTQKAQKLMGSKAEMLLLYQVRVEAAWPGFGTMMRLDNQGDYFLDLPPRLEVRDLEPLRGIPLSRLSFHNGPKVADLTPLKGMPLVQLILANSQVSDLSPLQGMKLNTLYLPGSNLRDLSPLQGMPLTTLEISRNAQIRDLSPLQGMPLTTLHIRFLGNVTELTPLKNMPLTHLDAEGVRVSDLSPLKGMPLKKLTIECTPQLRDLSPLQGMPMTNLRLDQCTGAANLAPLKDMPLADLTLMNCPAVDLSPLAGSKLTTCYFNGAPELTDLSPLKQAKIVNLAIQRAPKLTELSLEGMTLVSLDVDKCMKLNSLAGLKGTKLVSLIVSETAIQDLEPLRGMPLKSLKARNTKITNLQPLAGMQLETLDVEACAIDDLTPLKGMPLRTLGLFNCKKINDLSPLAGMSLFNVTLPPEANKIDALREMKSINSINGLPPVQYWKLRDAAKSKVK